MMGKNKFLLELSELQSKILQTQQTLDTKVSLIKAAIEEEKYVIHPQQIIHHMLGEEETCIFLAEPSL